MELTIVIIFILIWIIIFVCLSKILYKSAKKCEKEMEKYANKVFKANEAKRKFKKIWKYKKQGFKLRYKNDVRRKMF